MPLLGFREEVAEDVEEGRKRQAICAYREDKRDPEAGDMLYCWSELGTKNARKLCRWRCQSAFPIEIDISGAIAISGQRHHRDDLRRIAIDIGFASTRIMVQWFADTYAGTET